MKFNEDSRVKIPTIIHLVRLGYTYIPRKNHKHDPETNIFTDVFYSSIKKINKDLTDGDLKNIYDKILLSLKNNDLGKEFYEILTSDSGIKLIDFDNFENNSFNIVTELTYEKDGEEFRPDITILINGMPLSFIEVKIPNNKDGILAEQQRIQSRFKKKNFRNFINITQLIIFSNNMNYDDNSHLPLEGAFYLTTSYNKSNLNYFREEENLDIENLLKEISEEEENIILEDNNLVSIKNSKEFITNKDPNTPTNSLCTSILQKKRIAFFLKFGIAYIVNNKGYEKHIMRYPQFFATKEIRKKLDQGKKKGIIWHTQGSGKTALAYFSLKNLLNYFKSKNQVSKYYFIVDRTDLVDQANYEFRCRGLSVHNISSRKEFTKDIKSNAAIHNSDGNDEITVINIQKFDNDQSTIQKNDYNLDIQRIYFIDEVHRGYTKNGSFLASLEESDRNAIKIGLTGTPLLKRESNTKTLFGDYIHKYFYNKSILDGYTLRLIREIMETHEKRKLEKIIDEIKVEKGSINKTELYAKPIFVEPLLDFVIEDFKNFRILNEDSSVGAIVVCDSNEQAIMMNKIFKDKYLKKNLENKEETYNSKLLQKYEINSGSLILHDEGTKKERKDIIESFKDGKIDIIFVNRMLLTGFDAPRLKKLYLARKIESHNLLQALTRVNRTYKDFRYGYVVDFADIQEEFDKTNQTYLEELELELGDEIQNYNSILKNEKEIDDEIDQIKEILYRYDTDNLENFTKQIILISDRRELLKIVNSLRNTKELYNNIRLKGEYELLEKLDFKKFNLLYKLASGRLNYINQKSSQEKESNVKGLLNLALHNIESFSFIKTGQEELRLADEFKNLIKKVIDEERKNLDNLDPLYITLKEELERILKLKDIKNISKEQMSKNSIELEKVINSFQKLNISDQLLNEKYSNDSKFMRLHKELMRSNFINKKEKELFSVVNDLKKNTDIKIIQNSNILENEGYVKTMMSRIIFDTFNDKHNLNINKENIEYINKFIRNEYIIEHNSAFR